MNPNRLSNQLCDELLHKLDWRYAILPTGKLASVPCFLLNERPVINITMSSDIRVNVVSQSQWTKDLVNIGINLKNDDLTLSSLSKNWSLLCRSPQQYQVHKVELFRSVMHHILLQSQASVNIGNIRGPTSMFKEALEDAIADWPDNPGITWQKLCQVWDRFGFLWPLKIRLGHKKHVQESYTYDPQNRYHRLQEAKATAAAKLMAMEKGGPLPITEPYDPIFSPHPQPIHYLDGAGNYQGYFIGEDAEEPRMPSRWEILSWNVITREELFPVYELLPDQHMRNTIDAIMRYYIPPIPIQRPFKLRNMQTGDYLCWQVGSPDKSEKLRTKTPSNQPTVDSNDPQIVFGTQPQETMQATKSQYLWRFSWQGYPQAADEDPLWALDLSGPLEDYASHDILCGQQVYLHPACRTPVNTSPMALADREHAWLDTHTTFLSNKRGDTSKEEVRLTGVELARDDRNGDRRWKVELPWLGFSLDNEPSRDEDLNLDILIGRKRTILHGDCIYLWNVFYLSTHRPQPERSRSLTRPRSWSRFTHGPAARSALSHRCVYTPPPLQVARKALDARRKSLGPLQPVHAKEHALIHDPQERMWVIELATDRDIACHPNLQVWPTPPARAPARIPWRPHPPTTKSQTEFHLYTPMVSTSSRPESDTSESPSSSIADYGGGSSRRSSIRRVKSLSSIPDNMTYTSSEWEFPPARTSAISSASSTSSRHSAQSNQPPPPVKDVETTFEPMTDIDWNMELRRIAHLQARLKSSKSPKSPQWRDSLHLGAVASIVKESTQLMHRPPSQRRP